MHILQLPAPVSLGIQGDMAAGDYLCEDRNAAELMLRTPGSKMYPEPLDDGPSPLLALRVLVIGTTGFGDALLLTPCLRQIKRLNPNASLHVACFREYRQVFLGLPYVDGFEDYPLPTERLKEYDCVLCLERAVENNPRCREQHMTDRYAEHLGLGELDDKKPELNITDAEREWVFSSFQKAEGKRRIGVQVQAGVPCRTYPGSHLTLLVNALAKAGWDVWLMGRPGEFMANDRDSIHNLSRHGLTWRQSAAFLLTCDAFVGPDSSLLHAAGSLDIPSVGLYGPYPWKLRTAYYPSVFAIQGSEGCDAHPCFHVHHSGMAPFPQDQPCAKSGRCEVLASILPERVLAKIEQVAAKALTPALAG